MGIPVKRKGIVITIWELATDVGIASSLLILCKVVRVKVTIFQRLYIPVAMMAGLLALALGANGLNILPLSQASYGSVLIAIIFAGLGLVTEFPKRSVLVQRTGKLWAYNQLITISQWLFAIVIGSVVLSKLWPSLPPAFSVIMPSGFMGGHGTAAAVGESLAQLGWEEAMSLALASATFGVFLAILGGLAIVNVISRLGILKHVRQFDALEASFRKGLIPEQQRDSIGQETVSSASINAFTLHLSLVGVVVLLAYNLSSVSSSLNPLVNVPIFACAFLLGTLLRMLLKKSNALSHFDDKLLSMITSSATDFLVFFGIAAIKLHVLIAFAWPFLLLLLSGVVLCLFLVLFVAPRLFGQQNWVETGLFSWGWMTGTVAMGILLLRIVDPDSKSKVLDDYAIAYVPGSITDIVLVSLVPSLLMTGHLLSALVGMLCYLVIVLLAAFLLKQSSSNG